MKNLLKKASYQWFFFYIIILTILKTNFAYKSHGKSFLKLKSRLTKNLREYFFVQRMYPGTDPLDNIVESEKTSVKRFIEVNDNLIVMSNSISASAEIQDSVQMKDIFDPKNDNIGNARCCSRITYEEFPMSNCLRNIITRKILKKGTKNSCPRNKKPSKISINGPNSSPIFSPSFSKKVTKSRVMRSPKKQANFCIQLFIPEEARWRICSEKKSYIKRLHLKIIYNVIKLKSKNNKKILQKFIEDPKGLNPPSIGNWEWDRQDKWSGMCKTGIMQSPINYPRASLKKTRDHFNVSMKLLPSNTLIKKSFGEIIVVFLNFAGVLKLEVQGKYVVYTPKFVSFRFPGEVIIDGQRSMGDMQVHFTEINHQVIYINNNINNIKINKKFILFFRKLQL